MKIRNVFFAAMLSIVATTSAQALDIKVTETIDHVDVVHDGKTVRIQRIQDQENSLTGFYSKTSRKCPPFCAHPMQAAPGVQTVGEVEVIEFMQNELKNGSGVLIDARMPDWYAKGTIPGSVNVPFTVFWNEGTDSVTLRAAMRSFGVAQGKNTVLDFSRAKHLLLWCNGPWCDQSPRAIKGLLRIGYPPQKIHYYRGGMQMWLLMGLTTVVPKADKRAGTAAMQ